jgi:hypothetical protein
MTSLWTLRNLNPTEREMVRAANAGVLLSRDGPYDRQSMHTWGKTRQVRAEVLRQLLVDDQWTVHAKGVRLQGILITGQLDLTGSPKSFVNRVS